MFMAKVAAVHVDEAYLDEKARLHLNDARLIVYSHGEYRKVGDRLGTFGFSVENKKKRTHPHRRR